MSNRPISKRQRDAMYDAEAAGSTGITNASGYSIATARVLRNRGWVTLTFPTGKGWVIRITTGGKAWCERNRMTPEQVAVLIASNTRQGEYKRRAAEYVKNSRAALFKNDTTVSVKAAKMLADIPHPAQAPAKVEDVGWYLKDNTYSGPVYDIGSALCLIGEFCNYRAYPVRDRDLEALGEYEQGLAVFMNELGMIEAAP